ncbi:hypothetical protein DV096_14145 [Bradymonadaceae bacterium TMQ3]|nr:hypothetical protein DV096_14145 [Bradymonadaceae bacterium TMQ3]
MTTPLVQKTAEGTSSVATITCKRSSLPKCALKVRYIASWPLNATKLKISPQPNIEEPVRISKKAVIPIIVVVEVPS